MNVRVHYNDKKAQRKHRKMLRRFNGTRPHKTIRTVWYNRNILMNAGHLQVNKVAKPVANA